MCVVFNNYILNVMKYIRESFEKYGNFWKINSKNEVFEIWFSIVIDVNANLNIY